VTVLVPALLCAVAVALAVPPSAGALLSRRIRALGVTASRRAARPPPSGGLLVATGAAGAATAVATGGLGPAATTLPLAATALVAGVVSTVLVSRSRAVARARARRAAVIEACDVLASGLRVGQPPHRVLDRAAADVSALRAAATAARLGGDVPAALRSAAQPEGAEGLAAVAAAWTVADRSGAGPAEVLSRIAGVVRAEAEHRRQVDVALGTSRSTARLLAVLPLLGVALGSGIDAHPLDVLFGSPLGAWCLLIGTALAGAGQLWVERLAVGGVR
jgi:tight adherence protein B